MTDDTISVLMGVYNCEDTIRDAVSSIQNQTYTNWELILCDDGSTDGTYKAAQELAEQDDRIVLLKNDSNQGLNRTLNRCFRQSRGQYIARMDGDDVSVPTRFEKQHLFLLDHPEYDIVSSRMILFDECGDWGRTSSPERPTSDQVATRSPICHAPVMLRRECLEAVGGYSEKPYTRRVEDVDLWIRLYEKGYRCYNIQEPLYRMRNDQNAFQRRKYRYRINSTMVRLRGCKRLHLGVKCYLRAFFPMIVGLVPARVVFWLRRHRRKAKTR